MVLTQLATASDLTMISDEVVQRHLQRKQIAGGAGDLTAWLAVAKETGAERLIAGSFQRIGEQIRVDAQIHDVSTGRVAGGGSIVASEASLLTDVDVLTSKLAGALGSRLLIASNSRLSDLMTDDLEAYRLYTEGLQAANSLQNEEAIGHLEKAIARDPRFAMAYARIGYAYGITGLRVDLARPNFAKALELGARLSERDRLYVLAWQAIANGDFPRAIDHFRLIVSRYPMEIEAHDRLGKLLLGEQRLDEAIDVLRRGLAVDRESPQINNSLGAAYSYAGRHAEAISHHQRFVALSPGDPNAYDSLGLSYQWAGDYQKALAAYDDASRIDPGFEVAVVHRANTYWQMGRNRDAIRELRRYIEIAPSPNDRRRGFGELSIIYRALGDRARQAEATRQVTRIEPSMHIDALAALDRGDVATAKRLVQSERKVEPGRGARSFRRHEHAIAAGIARAEGDRSAAIASAREAVRLLPPIYVADDMEDVLGDILAAFAQWPEAIAEYGRVLRINPNRGRTRYKLARALESAGRVREARSEYERFLQVWSEADSDAPELVDARARLSRIHSTAP
jgi:tetratricopeptide (TPR) repeat protein